MAIIHSHFKHGIYCPFFPLQNAVCFINLTCLVPLLFTFYIQGVLKLKKNNSGAKRLMAILHLRYHRWRSSRYDYLESYLDDLQRWQDKTRQDKKSSTRRFSTHWPGGSPTTAGCWLRLLNLPLPPQQVFQAYLILNAGRNRRPWVVISPCTLNCAVI